ncbi:MAG TPA: FAD-dependent oxidoreductase [Thermoanaerobaculia bacterium]|jgi:sarcosine oxidase subunit beta|nr:FAD-dependent oxidoreductase [Thermoanaerobaculia bacterium]
MPSVVIVGAGVIGTSIAYHLAAQGLSDVMVIDRGTELGAGSTPRATGGFRAQFATAADIALSLLSREKLRRFEDEIGVDSGYRPYGYLFIARSEQAMAQLRIANELQHACGLPEARLIDAEEVRRINPAVVDDAIVGGTFCPTDGFIRAMKVLGGYFAAAQRLSVGFEFGVTVRGMRIEGDRIAALETSRGEIHADTFINAAGAWAGTLGVDILVAPLRRQVAATIETDVLPDTTPMTVWADDGFHFRVRDRRVLLLWPDSPPSSFDVAFDGSSWLPQVLDFTNARIPILRDVPIDPDACWAGLYEMSPDHHAILGRAPSLANLYLANGCSGHGVMHAPAIGQVLSELIVDGRSSIDIHSLRPSRFAEGEGIEAAALL